MSSLWEKTTIERWSAAATLGTTFSRVPDKTKAWQDLHRLTEDEDSGVRGGAAYALGTIFSQVPDKAEAWQDLHRLAQDKDRYVRGRAADALGAAFSQAQNKEEIWQDLHRLSEDEDRYVRGSAAAALGTVFSQVQDKAQALKDLLGLIQDKGRDVRWSAAYALGTIFSQVPDKAKAWQDLHKLTEDENSDVRGSAIDALGIAFDQVPDKAQAWQDLHRLTEDEDYDVRGRAAHALKIAFSYIPDQTQAWQDLQRLTKDKEFVVQCRAKDNLVTMLIQVPDKAKAWQNLIRLILGEDQSVQKSAATALGTIFSQVPDKAKAWRELYRLTHGGHSFARIAAVYTLGTVFSQVPDKVQAWQDLHRLTENEDSDVRRSAVEILGTAFNHVPDKAKAWQDLHKFTKDADRDVRVKAAHTLKVVISLVPDKDKAWQDLHRLTEDEESSVRRSAVEILGAVFSLVPDKDKAWQDLHRLTEDEDRDVQVYAYHSMGRASVFKAAEAVSNDILKKELEAAVAYFEKSSQEYTNSPARFCLPFYRAYFAITFQEAKEDEIQRYLSEAKEAVGGSESKDELLKAVENLAGALQESQKLKSKSIEEITGELNTYRWYCDKAAEHMDTAEYSAPGAVKLMRKCNLLLEDRIQATIAEIQKSAKRISQVTHRSSTEYEVPGSEIYKAAEALSSDNLAKVQISSSIIVMQLKMFCKLLPEGKRSTVCKVVEEIDCTLDFPEKLHNIALALSCLGPILQEHHQPPLVDIAILTVLPEEYSAVYNQLPDLSPPPKMSSRPNLYAWQFSNVPCSKHNGTYKVAVGMIGRAGSYQSALAVREAIDLWRPRYIFFVGIAGGLSDLKRGDVVIADIVYGYEYGKVDKKFKLRGNWTYRTDQGLLNGANIYALRADWYKRIKAKPPKKCKPNVICGEVASGEKVVDNPTNSFFAQVLKRLPKIKAVEMEGTGVCSAIEQAQSLGIPVGFMMIRSISDLPRPKGKGRGNQERDNWKQYASSTVAAFILGWIADGLPLRPSALNNIN